MLPSRDGILCLSCHWPDRCYPGVSGRGGSRTSVGLLFKVLGYRGRSETRGACLRTRLFWTLKESYGGPSWSPRTPGREPMAEPRPMLCQGTLWVSQPKGQEQKGSDRWCKHSRTFFRDCIRTVAQLFPLAFFSLRRWGILSNPLSLPARLV